MHGLALGETPKETANNRIEPRNRRIVTIRPIGGKAEAGEK
jgi:hypothetical protein